MVKTNIDWVSMSNRAIVRTIGEYVKSQRLSKNKTQAQIAQNAGVNRWTLSQLEKGEPVSLTSLIQILRALDLLDIFDRFRVETPQLSPIELAKAEQKKRQRARNKDIDLKKESEW